MAPIPTYSPHLHTVNTDRVTSSYRVPCSPHPHPATGVLFETVNNGMPLSASPGEALGCLLPLGASWDNRCAYILMSSAMGSCRVRVPSDFPLYVLTFQPCTNSGAGRAMCYHFVRFLVGKNTGSCEFISFTYEPCFCKLRSLRWGDCPPTPTRSFF